MRRRLTLLVTVVAIVAATGGLPGSKAFAAPKFHGSTTIAAVAPFTGADAVRGPKNQTASLAASQVINLAGGILGKQVNCKVVDTRRDPADAAPAVRQMYATTSNRVLVIGGTSDEASTVVPAVHAN